MEPAPEESKRREHELAALMKELDAVRQRGIDRISRQDSKSKRIDPPLLRRILHESPWRAEAESREDRLHRLLATASTHCVNPGPVVVLFGLTDELRGLEPYELYNQALKLSGLSSASAESKTVHARAMRRDLAQAIQKLVAARYEPRRARDSDDTDNRPHQGVVPPLDALLTELVGLQHDLGLQTDVIHECAPLLMDLPVTHDERGRGGLEADQAAQAARQVLVCATSSSAVDAVVRQVVSTTLGIGTDDWKLARRRWHLQRELNLSSTEYREFEATAYLTLAQYLVRLRQSPCRASARVRSQIDSIVHAIASLMAGLPLEEQPAARQEIARRVLTELPRAVNTLEQHGLQVADDPLRALLILTTALCARQFDPWAAAYRERIDPSAELLSGTGLRDALSVPLEDQPQAPRLETLEFSAELLAQIMAAVEAGGTWEETVVARVADQASEELAINPQRLRGRLS